ncbi:hypothetical protein [Methanoculleus sp.]|uniref:hypothetical protein n=1 Tax=Methanoculleus sp. TaxID=90427 RepID=UPI00260F064B|nr:hypothetical protein [Methanoculleus sp.]MDI6866289.1 hypothetical protein [Methanoculleus sp.]
MNCTTTCNSGLNRGSGEPPCRHPIHREISSSEPHIEETDQVWFEAGFLPPKEHRQAVALLHHLAMDEDPATPMLSSILSGMTGGLEFDRGYRIFDRSKLYHIASEYGIEPDGMSETEVAHSVTMAIINEYREEIEGDRR